MAGYASSLRPEYTGQTLPITIFEPTVRVSDIPVIFLPGLGGSAESAHGMLDFLGIVRKGFVGICASLSATGQGWGNTVERAAVLNALDYSHTVYGTDPVNFAVIAHSMGGFTHLNLAPTVQDRLLAAALVIPAISLEDVRQRDLDTLHLGIAASIEAAYGGLAGYLAALPGASPVNQPKAVGRTAQVTRIWAASNDNICSFPITQAYAAAAGIGLVNVGPLGHTSATGGLYWPDVVAWLTGMLLDDVAGDLLVAGNLTVHGSVRSV